MTIGGSPDDDWGLALITIWVSSDDDWSEDDWGLVVMTIGDKF